MTLPEGRSGCPSMVCALFDAFGSLTADRLYCARSMRALPEGRIQAAWQPEKCK
jgi:hypothetical protein